MPNEYGFRFKIEGEVFVVQNSKDGADVVGAYAKAIVIRTKIAAGLKDIPATFTIGEPMAASRRVPVAEDPDLLTVPAENGGTKTIDLRKAKPAEDGPTPELDLPSRKGAKA